MELTVTSANITLRNGYNVQSEPISIITNFKYDNVTMYFTITSQMSFAYNTITVYNGGAVPPVSDIINDILNAIGACCGSGGGYSYFPGGW